MAAILNTRLWNGAAEPMIEVEPDVYVPAIATLISELQNLEGNDKDQIKRIMYLMSVLDTYNNSGDSVAIIEPEAHADIEIPPADPNGVRDYIEAELADTIWDACY
jgi:hypothetical protein